MIPTHSYTHSRTDPTLYMMTTKNFKFETTRNDGRENGAK